MFPPQPSSAGASDLGEQRICRALVSVIDERGYAETSLDDLLARADVDLPTFRRSFTSLDECFVEVWKRYMHSLTEPLFAAYSAQPTWRDGMRAFRWELCRLIVEDHQRARICMVEINYGGDLAQGTRDLVLGAYVELVHLGRQEAGSRPGVRREQAEAVVGAVWDRAGRIINEGDDEAFIDEAPELLYLIFLPYLGSAVAQEELRRGREELERFKRDFL
jgi:AcrR family transcriptional regulator